MKKRIIAAIAGGVWLAAIGSAAALTYAIDRPVVFVPTTSSRAVAARGQSQLAETADEQATIDQSAMEMPGATIVGYPPSTQLGVAEMQGAGDLTVGPGVVTYPPEE
jgi:hypothetical protein